MAGADDQGRGGRGDDIPSGIANLGVIIGGPWVRPPANDNRPAPEPEEATGASGNREEAAPD